MTCPYSKAIWSWIANHNGFAFNCVNIEDLWLIDSCIPLKDKLLVELVRAATLWTIWLVRNRVCFDQITIPSLSSVGTNIISLASYWCKVRNDETFFKLTLILPMDVHNLNQGGSLTLLPVSDTLEDNDPHGLGEEGPGSEEEYPLDLMDLSDYLIARTDRKSTRLNSSHAQ